MDADTGTTELVEHPGNAIEDFIGKHRQEDVWIATGFISPLLAGCIERTPFNNLRLLVALERPDVPQSLFDCLKSLLTMHPNVEVRCLARLHAKVYLALGRELIVTSANFSKNAFTSLIEAGIRTTSPKILTDARFQFEGWWKQGTPLAQVELRVSEGEWIGETEPSSAMGQLRPSEFWDSKRASKSQGASGIDEDLEARLASIRNPHLVEFVRKWKDHGQRILPDSRFRLVYPAKKENWRVNLTRKHGYVWQTGRFERGATTDEDYWKQKLGSDADVGVASDGKHVKFKLKTKRHFDVFWTAISGELESIDLRHRSD